ncbi:MAG TPA: hypothetical protein VE975_02330 [Actinomycetota bacterium]|nr:hypothetical protein [Actinomycetota bacterium]
MSLLEPGTGTGLRSVTLDHLSSAYVWVNHPDGVPVHIDVKLPARHGARAFVLRAGPDGATQTLPVSVGSDGLGSVDVPSQAGASKLALLLVNASTRFSCWQGTWFTCQGAPRDDDARFAYSMKLR